MNIPVYNCLIDESTDDITGIHAISFVDCPANEVDFIALRKQQKEELRKDEKKQILTGVVLKPDQLIYRNSQEMGEYYIKFSAYEIGKIAHKMMRIGVALQSTSHQHQTVLSGNYLTELWIVEDPEKDKSRALGFDPLPVGTLMCSYKIEDKKYWNDEVMTGHVRGFSLEGLFTQQPDMQNRKKRLNKNNVEMNDKNRQKRTLLGRISRLLLDIDNVKNKDLTNSGEAYVLFVLADGNEAYIDQDGYATVDGEQMPAGEHKLSNGNLLVIDEQGNFVETKEASGKTQNPDEKTAPQTLRRKRSFLEDVKPSFVEALRAKLDEMQQTIDDLNQALADAENSAKEAKEEVETLRRKTPSVYPAMPKNNASKDVRELTTAERMAVALTQSLQRKK